MLPLCFAAAWEQTAFPLKERRKNRLMAAKVISEALLKFKRFFSSKDIFFRRHRGRLELVRGGSVPGHRLQVLPLRQRSASSGSTLASLDRLEKSLLSDTGRYKKLHLQSKYLALAFFRTLKHVLPLP